MGVSSASQPGTGGHEGWPKPLGAPGAAFKAEAQSILEDSCSVCGKVGKTAKIKQKQGPGPKGVSVPVCLDSLWGACVQDFCRR